MRAKRIWGIGLALGGCTLLPPLLVAYGLALPEWGRPYPSFQLILLWPIAAFAGVVALIAWGLSRTPLTAKVAVALCLGAAILSAVGAIGLAASHPAGFGYLAMVVLNPASNSYYQTAREHDNLWDMARSYHRFMPQLISHAQTQAPGPVLYYGVLGRWLRRLPQAQTLAAMLLAVHPGTTVANLLPAVRSWWGDWIDASDITTALLISVVTVLACAVGVWATGVVAVAAFGPRGGLITAGVLALTPSLILFTSCVDQIHVGVTAVLIAVMMVGWPFELGASKQCEQEGVGGMGADGGGGTLAAWCGKMIGWGRRENAGAGGSIRARESKGPVECGGGRDNGACGRTLLRGILCGALIMLASVFNLAYVTFLLVGMAAGLHWVLRRGSAGRGAVWAWVQVGAWAVGLCAGFGIGMVLAKATTGYDHLAVMRVSDQIRVAGYTSGWHRKYWPYLVRNFAEAAFLLAGPWLPALVLGWRRAVRSSKGVASLVVGALITAGLVAVSGRIRGETGRMWLYLWPWVAASVGLWRPLRVPTVWAVFAAAAALYVMLMSWVLQVWGF